MSNESNPLPLAQEPAIGLGHVLRNAIKQSRAYLPFFLLTALLLWCAPNRQWGDSGSDTPYGADFLQEWVGASILSSPDASRLYDVAMFQAWQHNPNRVGFEWNEANFFPPVYPPPHYAIFSWFALVPYRYAVILWIGLLGIAAFVSTKLVQQILLHDSTIAPQEVNREAAAQAGAYVWLRRIVQNDMWAIVILFPPVLFSMVLGQKSLVWLLLICMTIRLVQLNRDGLAGIVFGLLSIKPTLFFLLPLFMIRQGKWRFVYGCGISVVCLWGLTAMVVPFDLWQGFFANARHSGDYASQAGYRLDWSCNLLSLVSKEHLQVDVWIRFAMGACLAVYVLVTVFAKRVSLNDPQSWLSVMVATLLLSPHAYHYDLALLLLPLIWFAFRSPLHGLSTYAALAIAMAFSLPLTEMLQIPVLPILLLAILCEIRLRNRVQTHVQAISPAI